MKDVYILTKLLTNKMINIAVLLIARFNSTSRQQLGTKPQTKCTSRRQLGTKPQTKCISST